MTTLKTLYKNYMRSLHKGIISTGLRINMKPCFIYFHNNWNTIIYKAEKQTRI